MSAFNITSDQITKTVQFIVARLNRDLKEYLAAYHNPDYESYRNFDICSRRFDASLNEACQRLHGFDLLFVDYPNVQEEFKKARAACSEDRLLFGSLLISGKHFKDELLANVKEAA